jgi:uncharacterized membrane protein YdbT with pleckstrin-like domain
MAETPTASAARANGNGRHERRPVTAVITAGAQDAAEMVRSSAERAAARLPDAVAGAQGAARDTQRALESMPSQALVMGTSFSLGLGVGLFLSGANRLLVTLALVPAGAMALTMLGRE